MAWVSRVLAVGLATPFLWTVCAWHLCVVMWWHAVVRMVLWRDALVAILAELLVNPRSCTRLFSTLKTLTIVPRPVRLLDLFWLYDTPQNPCHIMAVIELEKASFERLRQATFEALVQHEPKMLCTVEPIMGRLCWLPVKIITPDNLVPDWPKSENRWTRERAFDFRMEDFYTLIEADLSKESGAAIVSRIQSEAMPRNAPFWRMGIMQDTRPGGSSYFLFKIHHCIADGTALAISVATRLLENHPLGDRSLTTSLPKSLNPFTVAVTHILTTYRTVNELVGILAEWCLLHPVARIDRDPRAGASAKGVLPPLLAFLERFTVKPLPMTGERCLSDPVAVPVQIVNELKAALTEQGGRKATFNDIACLGAALGWRRMLTPRAPSTPTQKCFAAIGSPPSGSPVTTAPQTPDAPQPRESALPPEELLPAAVPWKPKGGERPVSAECRQPSVHTALVTSCRLKYPTEANNYIAPVLLAFPTSDTRSASEILEQFEGVKVPLDHMKAKMHPFVWGNLIRLATALPHWLAVPIIRHMTDRVSMLLSSVQGPPFDGILRGGVPVRQMAFWPPSLNSIGRTVACLSYSDRVVFSVSLDKASVDEMRTAEEDMNVSPYEFAQRFAGAIADEVMRMHAALVGK